MFMNFNYASVLIVSIILFNSKFLFTQCISSTVNETKHSNSTTILAKRVGLNFNFSSSTTLKDHYLKKTVFSDRTRLLVVAGLEGTGHHAISAMFQVCSRKQPPLCEIEKSVSIKAMTYYVGQKLTRGLFGAGDTIISLQNAIAMKASLEAAVNRSGDHLYFVGLGGHKGSGMFSYPNYNGRFKSLDHPDIYQLGLLAEQAGMDYRVLVLQRNGLDILKSVDRRNFGTKVDEEPKILIDNAAALHAQVCDCN